LHDSKFDVHHRVRHRPGAKKGNCHWVVIVGVVVVKMYSLISLCGIPVHCTVVMYSRRQVCNSKEDIHTSSYVHALTSRCKQTMHRHRPMHYALSSWQKALRLLENLISWRELFTSCNISTLARKTWKSETFPPLFMPLLRSRLRAWDRKPACCYRRSGGAIFTCLCGLILDRTHVPNLHVIMRRNIW
jgi:hypothetical protein